MEGVRQIADAARAWGQTTTVVSLEAPGAPHLEGNPFASVALGPGRLHYGYTPRLVPWLREHVQEFDAVIVNGLWQYGGLGVWRVLHRGPVPYFVFPHGMLDPYFRHAFPLKHLKKWLYWPWAEYRVLRDARAVMFTCEEERLLARKSFWLYRCREEVVGYGTAPPPVDPDVASEAFHERFPELRGKRIVLFLSRVHEKKGCDLLINAFAAVAGKDPLLHLVIAGPSLKGLEVGLREQARALGIGDRLTWAGMLTGAVKWGALYSAEVFALTSHQENFGIAVAEALACGTPVLISNKINIWREIVADGAGLAAPDTQAGARELLEKWCKLLPQERAEMRAQARNCYERRFDIRAVARRMMSRVEQLVSASRPD